MSTPPEVWEAFIIERREAERHAYHGFAQIGLAHIDAWLAFVSRDVTWPS